MAIQETCEHCGKRFSAQDDYLGRKVKCPACGAKTPVLGEEERVRLETHEREQASWRSEQESRIKLIEEAIKLKEKSRGEDISFSLDRIRNYQHGSVSRLGKLRAFSSFCILSAYLGSALLLGMAVALVYLFKLGTVPNIGSLVLGLLGVLVLNIAYFVTMKFIAEISLVLADIGDYQLDTKNLLLDLREGSDRLLLKSEPTAHPGTVKSSGASR